MWESWKSVFCSIRGIQYQNGGVELQQGINIIIISSSKCASLAGMSGWLAHRALHSLHIELLAGPVYYE